MRKYLLPSTLTLIAAFALAACSSSDNDADLDADLTESGANSQFNPNAEPSLDDGSGGGDTTAIAGLWDGTINEGETSDMVYWDLSDDGVLTRYDYQQDGAPSASGDNCYIIGDPISVSPEDGEDYSFFNVAVTITNSDDTLTITFIDPDINDLDQDGDTAETPTLSWPLLSAPTVEDLTVVRQIQSRAHQQIIRRLHNPMETNLTCQPMLINRLHQHKAVVKPATKVSTWKLAQAMVAALVVFRSTTPKADHL